MKMLALFYHIYMLIGTIIHLKNIISKRTILRIKYLTSCLFTVINVSLYQHYALMYLLLLMQINKQGFHLFILDLLYKKRLIN